MSDQPSLPGEESATNRVLVFPPDVVEHEEKPLNVLRQKGVEMNRSMTQEDKELSAAGYEHLEAQKIKVGGPPGATNVDIQEHHLPFSKLEEVLRTSIDTKDASSSYGLTATEAQARLQRDGRNVLTPPHRKSAFRKFLDRLFTMFNILLMIAGVLEYVLLGIDFKANFQNTYLGGILILVAFINASIDFYQIQKSEAILASFLAMIPPSCRVVRDGTITNIAAADLVKGDVVLLRTGDKTPADLLIFSASDLKVDNSSLTGESEPQERFSLPDGSKHRPPEAENLVFNSTLVVNGEAWGIVVRTGDNTFIGQIASLTGGESGNESPLSREIGRFVMIVTNLWSGGKMYTAFQSNNDEEDTVQFSMNASGMTEMVDIAALNSRIKFDKTDIPFDQRAILGDATETGLTRFAGRYLDNYDAHVKSNPKVFEVPFNSTNKWALVILNMPHASGTLTSFIKGAPERVLAKCTTYLKDGVPQPITAEFTASYDAAYNVKHVLQIHLTLKD
ncbi:hypothetical protein H0H87_008568 [Tephrocybe sp. NHM501043]|nr:hypothetical protein H0H87_008568 [Tephrocybe sp. NHM501043]